MLLGGSDITNDVYKWRLKGKLYTEDLDRLKIILEKTPNGTSASDVAPKLIDSKAKISAVNNRVDDIKQGIGRLKTADRELLVFENNAKSRLVDINKELSSRNDLANELENEIIAFKKLSISDNNFDDVLTRNKKFRGDTISSLQKNFSGLQINGAVKKRKETESTITCAEKKIHDITDHHNLLAQQNNKWDEEYHVFGQQCSELADNVEKMKNKLAVHSAQLSELRSSTGAFSQTSGLGTELSTLKGLVEKLRPREEVLLRTREETREELTVTLSSIHDVEKKLTEGGQSALMDKERANANAERHKEEKGSMLIEMKKDISILQAKVDAVQQGVDDRELCIGLRRELEDEMRESDGGEVVSQEEEVNEEHLNEEMKELEALKKAIEGEENERTRISATIDALHEEEKKTKVLDQDIMDKNKAADKAEAQLEKLKRKLEKEIHAKKARLEAEGRRLLKKAEEDRKRKELEETKKREAEKKRDKEMERAWRIEEERRRRDEERARKEKEEFERRKQEEMARSLAEKVVSFSRIESLKPAETVTRPTRVRSRPLPKGIFESDGESSGDEDELDMDEIMNGPPVPKAYADPPNRVFTPTTSRPMGTMNRTPVDISFDLNDVLTSTPIQQPKTERRTSGGKKGRATSVKRGKRGRPAKRVN